MIHTPLSSITRSREAPLKTDVAIATEGQALVADYTGGAFGVKPAAGVANEKFVGFTWNHTSMYSYIEPSLAFGEEFLVPGSNVITLARTPVANSVFVRDLATGLAVVIAGVVGKDVTLTDGDGLTVSVIYRFLPTPVDNVFKQGHAKPAGYTGNIYRQTGYASAGALYTSHFDTGADWALTSTMRLGANGLVVNSGAGTIIDGYVIALPSQDYPFLGLQFNASA